MALAKEKQEQEMELQKLLKQQEMDAKLEMEEKDRKEKLEMEERIRLKEIEAKINSSSNSSQESKFVASRYTSLVPPFNEKEVDKFFLHFEKVAISQQWPNEHWTALVQSRFQGKARDAYTALSVEDCKDYDIVKAAVLKVYELVPEAYRQRFRSARKQNDETHVEFARGQEQLFDRWLTSKNVNDDFNQLRQLVLVEQFKSCVHADIKTHLDERDVNSLGDAATISDDYALTHKLSSGSSSGGPNRYNQGSKGYANRSNQNKSAQEGAKEENLSQVPQAREINLLAIVSLSQEMVTSR